MAIRSVHEVGLHIGFLFQLIEDISRFGDSEYTQGRQRLKIAFPVVHFLKADDLVGCHSFFFFFIALTCIRIQSVTSNGLQYFIMSTPLFHKTRNYLSQGRMDASLLRKGSAKEEASVDKGGGGCRLCAAGGLKRVPHESSSGTAALSGD